MSNDPNGEFPKNTKMAVTVHTPPNVLTSETAESTRATYRMLLTRTDELARARLGHRQEGELQHVAERILPLYATVNFPACGGS